MLSNTATVPRRRATAMCVRWKSATSFANFFRDDPVLDVFDRVKPSSLDDLIKFQPTRYPRRSTAPPPTTPTNPFFDQCIAKGTAFEEGMVKRVKELIPNHYDVGVTTRDAALSTRNYAVTLRLLKQRKLDCIIHGLVRNEKNQTFGAPDLMVLGRSIHLLGAPPCAPEHSNTYFAVDIKSSHIHLTADGQVANNPLSIGYKAQVLIYALAIKEMTRDTTSTLQAYLLGGSYSRGGESSKIAALETIGLVDFNHGVNAEMVSRLPSAIQWHNELEINMDSMVLDKPNRPELFPNMKNKYNRHYDDLKQQYAQHVDEITRMWQCGVPQRKHAHESGVKRLRDVNRVAVVGRSPDSRVGHVLDRMLASNTDPAAPPIAVPRCNNRFGWRFPRTNEWYLDIECVEGLIYMVGILHDGVYTCLRAPTLDTDGERSLLSSLIAAHPRFATYVVHWGSIEPRTIMNKMADYGIPGWEEFDDLTEWCDLLEVFRWADDPIVVRGALGFGLKEVARALSVSQLIPFHFATTDIASGLDSMQAARDAYALHDQAAMDALSAYNRADCTTLSDILALLRSS